MKSIKLFIDVMVKYVNKHESDPNLVPNIEAFLRRMNAQWSRYYYQRMMGRYPSSSWDDEYIDEKSNYDENVKSDRDFHNFSKEFYALLNKPGSMHDINQLISIVLLGAYENIRYYIGQIPVHIPKSAKIIGDSFAKGIDMRDERERYYHLFRQIHQSPGETQCIENAPIIPLFVKLAGFIVKNPTLSAELTDTAVEKAVDEAVAQAKKADAAAKGGRRTRHKKRSGNKNKKRSRSKRRSSRRH